MLNKKTLWRLRWIQIITSSKRKSQQTKRLLTNGIISGMVTAIQPAADAANELFK